jgi:hypothetical protein
MARPVQIDVRVALELHFGLGDATRVEEFTVRGPSGIVQRLGPQPAQQRVTITESR